MNPTFLPGRLGARSRVGRTRAARPSCVWAALFAEALPWRSACRNGRDRSASVSDLQFTARYRVPFQFSRFVRDNLKVGAFLESSGGVTVTDLDGNTFYDLTGSYGVNLFGYDFYKECIARGSEHVRDLGPVLGAFHRSWPTTCGG